MYSVRRVILVVLDSVGIGAMPDAAAYGDAGSNTVGNIARALGQLCLPNLGRLGLGNLLTIAGTPPVDHPAAAIGRMAIKSVGKDTMTGHWEMVGIKPSEPFRTYPEGFPSDLLAEFCRRTGVPGVLGNEVASGTEIIQRLGDEHVASGKPIVYTSADSVFQVAAHEETFGLERLYEVCKVAREMLHGDHRVGRVIARPFLGGQGDYTRTSNRHDYALTPPAMLLTQVQGTGQTVLSVGKIGDIFTEQGITDGRHTKDNADGMQLILAYMDRLDQGLIFANLVDFDMHFGHRRDVKGYGAALEAFDLYLPTLLAKLQPGDVLAITADHGNDPTFPGTDHTREYVPVLLTGAPIAAGANVGTRVSLADLGATVGELLRAPYQGEGTSFARTVLK